MFREFHLIFTGFLLATFLPACVAAQPSVCGARVLVTRVNSGIGVAGASGVAVDEADGKRYQSTLKEDMPYFAGLPEGPYRVTISKTGYKRSSRGFYLHCLMDNDNVYSWTVELYRGNSKQIVKLADSVRPRRGHPVSGGVLNGRAISLPEPEYPATAKAAKASGTVIVRMLIDVDGRVIFASAVSGHRLLRAASETAARAAKFSPTLLGGESVKVSGVLTYYFVP